MYLKKVMQKISQPVDFSHLTAVIFLFHGLVFLAGYLVLGVSPYITSGSVLLVIVLDLLFCSALFTSNDSSASQILVLSWFVIIFSLVRLTSLMFLPPQTLEFLTLDGFNAKEIYEGMVLYVSGSMAILLGIYAAARLFPQNKKSFNFALTSFSLWGITFYWLLTYVVAWDVLVYQGLTIFGPPEKWGSRTAWIRVVIDTDAALLITIGWLVAKWQSRTLSKSQMIHGGILVFLWLLFSIALGSRGGPLRILIFLFFAVLAVKPRFNLSMSKLMVLILSFFVLNSVVYTIGTVFRHYKIGEVSFSQAVMDYEKKYFHPKLGGMGDLTHVSDLRRSYYESEFVNEIGNKLRPTVTRLAMIDYSFLIFVKTPNTEILDFYIRSLYPLKNFANNLVPGEIFDDAIISTSRIFKIAYRGYSLGDIKQAYLSEPWTMWGMAWILGKYWGGLILFLTAFVMQSCFDIVRFASEKYVVYLRLVYLVTVVSTGYMMFGIDHELSFIAQFTLACIVAFAVIETFDYLGRKVSQRKLPAQ